MRERSSGAIIIGVLAAVVVLLVLGVAAWVFLSPRAGFGRVSDPDNVVVVLPATGEDGAQVAGIVAVVSRDGAVRILDPMMKVTIPGTSYDRLRDAYPFGGAAKVADSLRGEAGVGAGWVDVPEAGWESALAGRPLSVTLPQPMEVFNGSRLASFPSGMTTVTAGDVPLLLQGAAYLSDDARARVLEQVGSQTLKALGGAPPGAGVSTNLTAEGLSALYRSLSGR